MTTHLYLQIDRHFNLYLLYRLKYMVGLNYVHCCPSIQGVDWQKCSPLPLQMALQRREFQPS
jgi:hypothetical protein